MCGWEAEGCIQYSTAMSKPAPPAAGTSDPSLPTPKLGAMNTADAGAISPAAFSAILPFFDPPIAPNLDFTTSPFGCLGDGWSCCCGFCVPCVLYGKNAYRIEGANECLHTTLYCCCFPVALCFEIRHRGMLRQKMYRAKKGDKRLEDCLVVCCCPCFSVCQEAREIQIADRHWATLMQGQRPPGMIVGNPTAPPPMQM